MCSIFNINKLDDFVSKILNNELVIFPTQNTYVVGINAFYEKAILTLNEFKKSKKYTSLICCSGIGMDMAANKHKNIRAALCYNIKSTKLSRLHNNANVMAIGARLTKKNLALKCVSAFMLTPFEGGRHNKRVKKI